MKNLVIGLFAIGLTTLGFSQEKNSLFDEIKLKDVIISHNSNNEVFKANINFNYLDKVQDYTTASFVKELESEASRYNVLESPKFDGRDEPFKIIFKGTKGYIIATYDSSGKILTTKEHYKDIMLPKNMSKSIAMQYPQSGVLKVVHTVNYTDQKDVTKIYRVQIMNNNSKKNLKFTSKGNDNNSFVMILED